MNPYAPSRADEQSSGAPQQQPPNDATKWLIPVNRSWWAIAAGYLGLFTILVIPAPLAIAVSIGAMFHLKANPDKLGWGRAIFGLVMGVLFSSLWLLIALR